MDPTEVAHIDPTIAQALPQGEFLMTSQADDLCAGFVTKWVQQCSQVPMLVSVAIPRGTSIEPVLRDSRHFAICCIRPDDRVIQRRFGHAPNRIEDPYVGLRCFTDVTGSPILQRCRYYLDCELVGHLAMESDCRIYIGQVLSGRVLEELDSQEDHHLNVNGNGRINGHANGNGHTNGNGNGHMNGNGHTNGNGHANGNGNGHVNGNGSRRSKRSVN